MTWLKIVFSDEGLTALLVCLMTGGGGRGWYDRVQDISLLLLLLLAVVVVVDI